MSINKILTKIKQSLSFEIYHFIFQKSRIIKYKIMSNCHSVKGKPQYNSPVLINGKGTVIFEGEVNLGVVSSPFFYNTYIYIEARNINSTVKIENGVWINNNASIISDGEGVYIGRDTLIGANFSVYDSDFHNLSPLNRNDGSHKTSAVIINDNVFIGSNVTVLKGVIIGENSVIANGSVVTKSIPPNVIAGGNPCRFLKNIEC
jgi:acetyltransferase-like isoleucine patch superfamily enzyme